MRTLRKLAPLAVPLVLLGVALALFRERGELLAGAEVLKHASPLWLLGAILAQALYLALFWSFQQRALKAAGVTLSYGAVARLWARALATNLVVPGSGSALAVATAVRSGASPERATAGLLLTRVTDLLGFGLVLALGLGWLGLHGQLTRVELFGAGGLALIVVGWSLPLLLARSRPALLARWLGPARAEEARAAASLAPGSLAKLLGFSLLAHAMDLLAFALLLPAFGLALRPELAVVGFGATVLFWIVTFVPEGVGTSEAAGVLALHALGAPLPQATAVVVGFRALGLWIPLLGGAALALPKPSPVAAPRIAAAFVALSGVVNVLSAVQPALVLRRAVLTHAGLHPFAHASRLGSAFLGFALLLLAFGLWRRKRSALVLTQAALSLSILTHLGKGLDWEEATVSLVALLFLLAHRKRFHALSDAPTLLRGLTTLGLALLFTLAYGTVGFYLLDAHYKVNFDLPSAVKQTVLMFVSLDDPHLQPTTGFGRWFAGSIYAIAAGSLGYGLLASLAPVLLRRPATLAERDRARKIVETFGASSVARFALLPDKSYWFSPGGSVVAYALAGRVAAALDDPIGPETDIEAAIAGFRDFAEKRDWLPAFFHVLPNRLPLYRTAGFAHQCIGNEAIVPLKDFSLEGRSRKKLRNAVTCARSRGYRAEVLYAPHAPALLDACEAVSDDWLATRGDREKGFSLGWFDRGYLQEGPLAVVYDAEGKLVAFANIIPEYLASEANIDLMRRTETDTPVMELLFVTLFEWAASQGFDTFTLGLAPLSGVGEGEGEADPLVARTAEVLRRRLDGFYGFNGLRKFKEKFDPVWEPRYLIVPTLASVPAAAIAVVRAGNGNKPLWRVLRWREIFKFQSAPLT